MPNWTARSRAALVALTLLLALTSVGQAGAPGQRGARGSLLPAAKRLGLVQRARLRMQAVRRPPSRNRQRWLRAYARTYASWLHTYNGAFPDEALVKDPRFKDQLHGQVPYWDVDPAQVTSDVADISKPRVDLIGLAGGSPFITSTGKLRIYTHYLNKTARQQLEGTFGAPTGHVPAMMTSSFRTIILFPEDGAPFQLKFSGDEATPWGASKQLPDRQVQTSIERGLRLRKNQRVIPELAGLLVGGSGKLGKGLNVIYRPLPLPEKPGDRLITWHVLMSPEFRSSAQGRRLFRRHGSPEAWFRKEAAPAVADLLADSLLNTFAHFELHSQNVDLMVGRDGTVRKAYAKDLLDIMHDPAAQAASGRNPIAQRVLKDGEWGDAADSENHEISMASLGGFYQSYFSQLGMDVTSRRTSSRYAGLTTETAFRGWVMDELYTRVASARDMNALARFPDFKAFQDPQQRSASPYQAIDGLRNAIIKDQLTRSFHEDGSARTRFTGSPTIVSDTKAHARSFDAKASGLAFGFVGETPVAVVRGDGGLVRDFYFAFEQ